MTEIIIAIIGIAYVFCMLWIVLCECVEDFVLDINYRSLNPDISGDQAIIEHNFIPNFALQNEQREDVLITIFYFVFTTLTTVGLGDYYPVGD